MKRFSIILMTIILSFFITIHAQSTTIGFDPSFTSVTQGDSFDVELFISDLGNGVAPSLGAFDIDVAFDASIISFTGATFGDPGIGDQLDLSGFGLNPSGIAPSPGSVNLFEVSLDFPFDLDDFQAPAFTLATLSFDAIAVGVSMLQIDRSVLSDSLGAPLRADTLLIGEVVVDPVPEPMTLLLVGFGLLGFAGVSRRKE